LDQFVSVARIVKTRGIRGEVSAEILSDFPERFSILNQVFVSSGSQGSWEVLEDHWFHGKRVILKFEGRNRPHEVEELVGCNVQIPLSERVDPPSDTFFDSDLMNCQVVEEGNVLGVVNDIQKAGSEVANLVVRTPDEKEFMIPLVREFVLEVDTDRGKISVQLPPGLTELEVKPRSSKKRNHEG
jgi:16S rRNA processing protein RimM